LPKYLIFWKGEIQTQGLCGSFIADGDKNGSATDFLWQTGRRFAKIACCAPASISARIDFG
jgi:hypothetical protein